jgi:phage tail protein X
MNLLTGEVSNALFGEGRMPESVRRLIDQAQAAPANHREVLLWTARASAPDSLAIYYLLYKHYAVLRNLIEAERAARRGLAEAAAQAGIATDWKRVRPHDADFSQPGPARFWLFTLKALAFLRLRAGGSNEAREMLRLIKAIDPGDSLGAGVVDALADATAPRRKSGRSAQ